MSARRTGSRLRALVVCLTALCACPLTQAAESTDCARLADFVLPGTRLTISKTERIAAGPAAATARGGPAYTGALPARCVVEGVIDQRMGVGGVSYGIHFALALPDDWNGRFLFQGGGGLNGSVQPPLGAAAAKPLMPLSTSRSRRRMRTTIRLLSLRERATR